MFPKLVMNALLLCLLPAALGSAQQLSPKWEELTAEDFVKALQSSSGVCLLPFGIIEKHGPSGPLGTDLINVRGATLEAVKQQYAIVFPEYYFGQIAEARHQQEPLPTVPICSLRSCRQPPMRWRAMAATKC